MKKKLFIGVVLHLSLLNTASQKLQNMDHSSIWDHELCNAQEKAALFAHDCITRKGENAKIPPKLPNTLRIATYNVHTWKTRFYQNSFAQIYKIIQDIDADILLFQEAEWETASIRQAFKDLGYLYHEYCHEQTPSDVGPMGNLVLSKTPFIASTQGCFSGPQRIHPITQKAEPPSYIKITAQLPDQRTAAIYCTHFDVYGDADSDANRLQQAQELIELSNNDATDLVIVGADCNAIRTKDYQATIWEKLKKDRFKNGLKTETRALEALEAGGFIDSFTSSNQKAPGFTVWSGLTVDFIWLKNKSGKKLVTQSYVYYDAASDHIPVIVDIKVR